VHTYRGLNKKEKKKKLLYKEKEISIFKTMKGLKIEIESPKKLDMFFLLDELHLIKKLAEKIEESSNIIEGIYNGRKRI